MHELLLGLLLLLAIGWLVVRIRRNKAEAVADAKPTRKSTGAFNAVAISYSEKACDAAKAMTGRRFLATAAPRLPLPECDFLDCRCQFKQYDDRRSGQDRRTPFAPAGPAGTTGSFERERRQRADRRKKS